MIYRFGPFVLDTDIPELRRDGVPVAAEPQVFDLVAALIAGRDRVLSKDALIEAVWQGRIVSDATITSRINLARQALGDSGRAQAYIRTFPKRGWRFVAPVESGAAGSGPGPAPAHAEPPEASILVLPFKDLTAGGSGHLAEGLTEDLIVALSRFRDLSVISINSALKLAEAGGRLDSPLAGIAAAYLVSGTIRVSGERLLVTVQLADKATGATVWSERFDREIGDLFALQDEMVEQIAGRLPWRVFETEGRRMQAAGAPKLSSYRAYLKASWEGARHHDIDREMRDFEAIVAADAAFAPARAHLAFLMAYKVFMTGRQTREEIEASLAHARAAIGLDPENERVLAKAAMVFQFAGDHALGLRCSEKAVTINPNSTECSHYRATILGASGDAEAALRWHAKTMRLDPLFPEEHYEGMIEANYLLGRYAEALELFGRWTSPVGHAYAFAAACRAMLGDAARAAEMAARFGRACPAGFSNAVFIAAMLRYHAREADRAHWLQGFRDAGIAESERVRLEDIGAVS